MLPKIHILVGIFFSLAIYFLFPEIGLLGTGIIFFSSFLIDVDHYFYYITKEKNLNFFKCYKWYKKNLKRTLSLPMKERKRIYSGFYLFHGFEWIIFLFFLGRYLNPIFYFVSFGFLLHWSLDSPHEYAVKRTFDKSSLIYNYYRFRKSIKDIP